MIRYELLDLNGIVITEIIANNAREAMDQAIEFDSAMYLVCGNKLLRVKK